MNVGDKKSFVLYFDIRGPMELLSDEDRGKLFLAILDYAEKGTCPFFESAGLDMAFAFIRTAIDRDTKAWEDKCTKRSEAGRLGGLAKQANATLAKQKEQNVANQAVPVPVPEIVPVPGNNIEADKPPRASRFVPPTVEEVRAYCLERGNRVNPQEFVDFYDASGWMRGRTKIKDWKACVRTWEKANKSISDPKRYDDEGGCL